METISLYRAFDGETICEFGDIRTRLGGNDTSYIIDCQYIPELEQLYLFAGDENGAIGVLNVNLDSLTLLDTFNGNQTGDLVRGVVFNQAKQMLVSVAENSNIYLWK